MSDRHNVPKDIDINLIRAEINVEADQWRRRDPEIATLERNIRRAWLDVAPLGAGTKDEQHIDRFEKLGQVKVSVPFEPRLHIRIFKRAIDKVIRVIDKVTLRYVQYSIGQINGILNPLTKYLRHINSRIEGVESNTRWHTEHSHLFGVIPDLQAETAEAVANLIGSRSCAVLSCGEGSVLEAICNGGGGGYGIEEDPRLVLIAAKRGLDVRLGGIEKHLKDAEDHSLESIVLGGQVERLPVGVLIDLTQQVKRVVANTGVVVVAVADPAERSEPEKELLSGCGLSPRAWEYLMAQNRFTTRIIETGDSRVPKLVFAQSS